MNMLNALLLLECDACDAVFERHTWADGSDENTWTEALNILYGRKLADAWITLPNTNLMFGGDTPLNYLKKGGIPAFMRVRQLLDARRGGR